MSYIKKIVVPAAHARKVFTAMHAKGGERWWTNTVEVEGKTYGLDYDYANCREAQNATKWVSINLVVNGVKNRLFISGKGERHQGRISPGTDEGVRRALEKNPNPKFPIEKRKGGPCFTVKKYKTPVQLAEDGTMIGEPPGDDQVSDLYMALYYADLAFTEDATSRLEAGAEFVKAAIKARKDNPTITVNEFFAQYGGAPAKGALFLAESDIQKLRGPGLYSIPKDLDQLTRGCILTSTTKVVSIGQVYAKNGRPLPSPLVRFKIELAKVNPTIIHDKTQMFFNGDKRVYEIFRHGDNVLTEENIHEAIHPGTEFDGLVDASSVCFSNMAISAPTKATVLVIQVPRGSTSVNDLDDLYGDEDGYSAAPQDPYPSASRPEYLSRPGEDATADVTADEMGALLEAI